MSPNDQTMIIPVSQSIAPLPATVAALAAMKVKLLCPVLIAITRVTELGRLRGALGMAHREIRIQGGAVVGVVVEPIGVLRVPLEALRSSKEAVGDPGFARVVSTYEAVDCRLHRCQRAVGLPRNRGRVRRRPCTRASQECAHEKGADSQPQDSIVTRQGVYPRGVAVPWASVRECTWRAMGPDTCTIVAPASSRVGSEPNSAGQRPMLGGLDGGTTVRRTLTAAAAVVLAIMATATGCADQGANAPTPADLRAELALLDVDFVLGHQEPRLLRKATSLIEPPRDPVFSPVTPPGSTPAK